MNVLPFTISKGNPWPFGLSSSGEGLNFSVISTSAKKVTLCLFSPSDLQQPAYEIPLDPLYKTGAVWHVCLTPPPANLFYLYRVDDLKTFLLDPYAKSLTSFQTWKGPDPDNYHPYGIVSTEATFNWENDASPNLKLQDLIIYEMHVRGFTKHTSSKTQHPGTFLGVIEKIPHLLDLGVNSIELLPIFEFDETEYQRINPLTQERLCNYWGYSTVNFFAPMEHYAYSNTPGSAITEFKTMVKHLHRHGIEVILDVVYNHSAEGNSDGPTISFKGLNSDVYYILDDKGKYLNYTGCGNTFNCNHPIVQELILSSLRYWVAEMHVDGFRFDLASIMSRGPRGEVLNNPPILEMISKDPILANSKLIAEPWDSAGLYQVGSFFPSSGKRWSEWNARYRDTVRRFIKGAGQKGSFAASLCGSQDMYYRSAPCRSVNFVNAHDGFTLADLVSYNHKHNLENGESNRDGTENNDSWNCGVEGETSEIEILALRAKQMRNFHLALMISRGIPMIHMGDEYGHTKKGNNNTWCQDNILNWFLWDKLEQNKSFYRFYKGLINFRKDHALLRQNRFFTPADIEWHGQALLQPQWDKNIPFIALTLKDPNGNDLYAAFNACPASIKIELPKNTTEHQWHWVVNTANEPPHDFFEGNYSLPIIGEKYNMDAYSSILLKIDT